METFDHLRFRHYLLPLSMLLTKLYKKIKPLFLRNCDWPCCHSALILQHTQTVLKMGPSL